MNKNLSGTVPIVQYSTYGTYSTGTYLPCLLYGSTSLLVMVWLREPLFIETYRYATVRYLLYSTVPKVRYVRYGMYLRVLYILYYTLLHGSESPVTYGVV